MLMSVSVMIIKVWILSSNSFLKVVGKNPLFLNCLLGREMAHWIRCLLDKCEDKDLDSQTQRKSCKSCVDMVASLKTQRAGDGD